LASTGIMEKCYYSGFVVFRPGAVCGRKWWVRKL
jgi:hypothetical protein